MANTGIISLFFIFDFGASNIQISQNQGLEEFKDYQELVRRQIQKYFNDYEEICNEFLKLHQKN